MRDLISSVPVGTSDRCEFMQTHQERLYIASRIVDGVADCLVDYASCNQSAELFGLLELVGRLDLAVVTIRDVNGASY